MMESDIPHAQFILVSLLVLPETVFCVEVFTELLHHVFINPRRACAARLVCVSVSLFVCLSVDDYSRTTGYEAAYERYQQLQCYKGMKINVAILLKRLHSRDMA